VVLVGALTILSPIKEKSATLIFNPSIDFLVARVYGLSLGIATIFSPAYTFVGLNLSYLLLGIVSPKRDK